MRKIIAIFMLFALASVLHGQSKVWSLDSCMNYAIHHSTQSQKQALLNANAKADYQASLGAFLPAVNGSIDGSASYGRNVDPATNGISNTSNFNNNYGLNARMPLFNAGALINTAKINKVAQWIGREKLQQVNDDLCFEILRAYADVIYYRAAIALADEQLTTSQNNLKKSSTMEQIGLKSRADVAQVEAQVAADSYQLVHQQNLLNTALLTLKSKMNYPLADTLALDTTLQHRSSILVNPDEVYQAALTLNPTVQQARLTLRSSQLNYAKAKAQRYPSIYLEGGISTRYYYNLKGDKSGVDFMTQLSNNRGQWFGAVINIPLFNGLSTHSSVRKARNNVAIAQLAQQETERQVQTEIAQAIQDRDGLFKELEQMKKQVTANQLAYRLAQSKYEKGLLNPIDLQTSANALLLSRTNQLQTQINYELKCRLVNYYQKGIIINNN